MRKTKRAIVLLTISVLCVSFCSCNITYNWDNTDSESELFESPMDEIEVDDVETEEIAPVAEYISSNKIKITIPEQFYGEVKYAIITNDKGETETISIPDSRIVEFTVKLDKITIREESDEYVNLSVSLYNENDDAIANGLSL